VEAKLYIGILAFAVAVPLLSASAKEQQPTRYQQGTVLSVAEERSWRSRTFLRLREPPGSR